MTIHRFISCLSSLLILSHFGLSEGEAIQGADKVNSMAKTLGLKMGGNESYDYLALKNHTGPSGVPVGGIGAGYFAYLPDGCFSKVGINSVQSEAWDLEPVIRTVKGTFLSVWDEKGARLLQRGEDLYGMAAAKKTVYRGLFPIAENTIDDDVQVKVWSSLIPHNLKDSSFPLAWVEVTLVNGEKKDRTMAVAFSWEDVIGRQIRDLSDLRLLRDSERNADAWQRSEILDKHFNKEWAFMPRTETSVEPFEVGRFKGLRQFSKPLKYNLKTHQSYNNEVAILLEKQEGVESSLLGRYPVDKAKGDDFWKGFCKEGRLGSLKTSTPLFNPESKEEMASALAARFTLKPGERRTIRFAVAWFCPEIVIDPAKEDPMSYLGSADYNKYFHRSFKTLAELIRYAGEIREKTEKDTSAWHQPILASTYPDWLKFKLINSAYTIYTNSTLNKAGDFGILEGNMGGLGGTIDQQLSAYPFFFKFFPELQRSNLELFGTCPGEGGRIIHSNFQYFFGISSRDGFNPTPIGWMVDNTGGWLHQMAACAEQYGEVSWIKPFAKQIQDSLKFMETLKKSDQFQIVVGPTTYDDFWHPEIYAYNATTYPSFLHAGASLLDWLGNSKEAAACRKQAEISSQDATKALWNGKFFAYGVELDGSKRRDDIMFTGQLAGQFLNRYMGWGDLFPISQVQSSIRSQLETSIWNSVDYYAPKVWLIQEKKAMRDPRRPEDTNGDSTCWPFYLESYTAMAAIQAGYVEDGLEIMRHIQLVHLRNGWTWTQNLWQPAECTYMTAPVTWFITDVLAGSSLNIPKETLALAPVIQTKDQPVSLPIYFPTFWGTLTADPSTQKINFKVTKVFEGSPITLRHIKTQPVGVATSEGKTFDIPAFVVKEGAVLDLSNHWKEMTASKQIPSVLAKLKK